MPGRQTIKSQEQWFEEATHDYSDEQKIVFTPDAADFSFNAVYHTSPHTLEEKLDVVLKHIMRDTYETEEGTAAPTEPDEETTPGTGSTLPQNGHPHDDKDTCETEEGADTPTESDGAITPGTDSALPQNDEGEYRASNLIATTATNTTSHSYTSVGRSGSWEASSSSDDSSSTQMSNPSGRNLLWRPSVHWPRERILHEARYVLEWDDILHEQSVMIPEAVCVPRPQTCFFCRLRTDERIWSCSIHDIVCAYDLCPYHLVHRSFGIHLRPWEDAAFSLAAVYGYVYIGDTRVLEPETAEQVIAFFEKMRQEGSLYRNIILRRRDGVREPIPSLPNDRHH